MRFSATSSGALRVALGLVAPAVVRSESRLECLLTPQGPDGYEEDGECLEFPLSPQGPNGYEEDGE